MSEKYRNIAIGFGAVIIGGFAIFSNTSNGQTIKVTDDGVRPVEVQKIVVTKTETKPAETVMTSVFDGTFSDLVNEDIPRAIKARDEAIANADRATAYVVQLETLRDQIQVQLDKLPERSVADPVSEVITK